MSETVDGGFVLKRVGLPDTEDSVVLLDPDRRPEGVLPWHPFANLLRVTPGGEVVWRAEPLAGDDWKCWVGVASDDRTLRAWGSAHVCVIDVESGSIVSSSFTK